MLRRHFLGTASSRFEAADLALLYNPLRPVLIATTAGVERNLNAAIKPLLPFLIGNQISAVVQELEEQCFVTAISASKILRIHGPVSRGDLFTGRPRPGPRAP